MTLDVDPDTVMALFVIILLPPFAESILSVLPLNVKLCSPFIVLPVPVAVKIELSILFIIFDVFTFSLFIFTYIFPVIPDLII